MQERIGLLPWLHRLLFGYQPDGTEHTCSEFTQWVACSRLLRAVACGGKILPEEERYEYSELFQERRCTLCGLIFQKPLKFDSYFDEDDEGDEDDSTET